MIRGGLLFILLTTFPSALLAAGKFDVAEAHGPIALGLGPGYANYRVMNVDGSWAGYRGISYLGSLEIRILNFEQAAVSIFGDYSFGKAKETSSGEASLEHTGMSYGLRFYPTPGFFLGVGYGSANEKLTTEGSTTNLSHHFTKMGLGFEWRMSGSWAMGLQSYYKSGPISKEDNSTLNSNSSFEGIEAFLLLIWSPPVLNIMTGN